MKMPFNKKALAVATLALAGAVTGCSDAERASFKNLGEEAKVKVYSGGSLIYEGVASGKIENESGSDGYYFNDKCATSTNKLVEVSGDVVISRDDLSCPESREPVYAAQKKTAAPAPK